MSTNISRLASCMLLIAGAVFQFNAHRVECGDWSKLKSISNQDSERGTAAITITAEVPTHNTVTKSAERGDADIGSDSDEESSWWASSDLIPRKRRYDDTSNEEGECRSTKKRLCEIQLECNYFHIFRYREDLNALDVAGDGRGGLGRASHNSASEAPEFNPLLGKLNYTLQSNKTGRVPAVIHGSIHDDYGFKPFRGNSYYFATNSKLYVPSYFRSHPDISPLLWDFFNKLQKETTWEINSLISQKNMYDNSEVDAKFLSLIPEYLWRIGRGVIMSRGKLVVCSILRRASDGNYNRATIRGCYFGIYEIEELQYDRLSSASKNNGFDGDPAPFVLFEADGASYTIVDASELVPTGCDSYSLKIAII